MKEIHQYQCEKCCKVYNKPERAKQCEDHHVLLENVSIEHMDFRFPSNDTQILSKHYPKRIKLKFSNEHGDFGWYELTDYGYGCQDYK